MIDAKQLRIGNKVLCRGQVDTVVGVGIGNGYCKNNGYFNDDKGYIEPIPMTSELLKACGFNIRPEERFYIFHNERVLFEYWLLDGSIVIEGGFIGYKIQHLHQLQNLFFALTGTELTVNLDKVKV